MIGPDRTPCVVPFCRRTIKKQHGFEEWICAKHWQAVPRRLKWLMRACKRKFRRFGYNPQIAALENRVWQKCKAAACESLR